MGKRDEALACWQEAVRLEPGYPEGHFNLAVGLVEQRRVEEAAVHYENVLQLRPDCSEAYSNLGLLRFEQGRPAEAVILLQQAIRLKTDYADAHNNLALALVDMNRPDEALTHYREALRIRPMDAETHNNQGTALAALERIDEALASYQQALRIKPGYPEAHWHEALTWLQQGDSGARLAGLRMAPETSPGPPECFREPLWTAAICRARRSCCGVNKASATPFNSFAMLRWSRPKSRNVVVECPPKPRQIFSTCAGIDQLVPQESNLPAFDVQIPLLSLPGIFGTRMHSIPAANGPYGSSEKICNTTSEKQPSQQT